MTTTSMIFLFLIILNLIILIRVKDGFAGAYSNVIVVSFNKFCLSLSSRLELVINLNDEFMKNTVKVANVVIGAEIENNGYQVRLVNINLVDPIEQFKVNEDGDKELKAIKQLTVRMSEFTRLLVLDEALALVPEKSVVDEEGRLNEQEKLSIRYEDQLRLLKGATISIDREEIKEDVLDDDGNPVKDDDGKVQKELVGFGETKFTKLELTSIAKKLCEKLIGL